MQIQVPQLVHYVLDGLGAVFLARLHILIHNIGIILHEVDCKMMTNIINIIR